VPLTTWTATTTKCAGPTSVILLSTLTSLLNPILESITGPKQGPPLAGIGLGGCTPPPAALAPLLGSASAEVVTSTAGSLTASVSATGTALAEQSATASTDLDSPITLNSPVSSVDFTVPYTTTGITATPSQPGSFAGAFLGWVALPGTIVCTSGKTRAILSSPSGLNLDAPTPASSGTWTGSLACPDGSDIPAGVIQLRVGALVDADSTTSQTAAATANISMHDVTATVNP
jgi:hypothetical protein